jgi:outer membrane protein OmpA-like peptidoglycan-associated protein
MAIFLLLPFFFSGCSVFSPEIRYDENTRTYNQQTGDNPGTSSYTVGQYDNTTAQYSSTRGPRTTKYTNKTGGKRYTIGQYEEATDYYVNRTKNSDISPKPKQRQQTDNFPANMTPEEQRASLPLVIEVSDVLFEFDKWVIKADFVPELDRWVEYFKNNPMVTADIYGHADSTGPETYNQKLSERRAEAVVNYMAERGIEKERLTTKGFGESQPAVPNDTREGRQKNRRVELNF